MGWLTDWLERATEYLDPGQPGSHDPRHHRRGARVWTPPNLTGRALARAAERELARWERACARPGDQPGLRLWGTVGLRRWQEGQHILLLGATGAGKTTILEGWLQQIIQRGDRVLVFDPKSDLVTWLLDEHRQRTQLLAPWDARSAAWGLGADITSLLDADEAARVLSPDQPEARDQFWPRAAQTVMAAILQGLVAGGRPWGWREVWSAFAGGPGHVLRISHHTPAGRLAQSILEEGRKGRTSSQDVWATVVADARWVYYLGEAWPRGGSFSVRAWAAGAGPQVLLLPVVPRYRLLGERVARLVTEIAASWLLSQRDDPDRRLWFVMDEWSALGQMPAVRELLLRARSKGGAIAAALQDLGLLRRAWGRDEAAALLNAFGTLLVLRLNDPDLARWAADAIGRREIVERLASRSEHDSGESRGHAEHVREEYAVLPSEFMRQPDLTGHLRVPGWPCIVHLAWSRTERPRSAHAVVEAEWVRRLGGDEDAWEKTQDIRPQSAEQEQAAEREGEPDYNLLDLSDITGL
jgi:type IV secretory pathway TraG/TraD family ATPase VirD4